jgi:hypothetical protein
MRVRLAVYSSLGLLALVLVVIAWINAGSRSVARNDGEHEVPNTHDVTEYHTPPPEPDDELSDDRLDDKHPEFIAGLVDRRHEGDWIVNASSAVLKLDPPMLRPDVDAALLVLRPSYAEAIAAAPSGSKVLPSINLIDGKAKQFDDGMMAAIDVACYNGWNSRLAGDVSLVKRLHERVGPEGAASPFLAAGLKIAGVEVKTARPDEVSAWLQRFEDRPMASKPTGFYTWSEELTRVFRFKRFFQQPLVDDETGLVTDLARAVGSDAGLREDYKKAVAFQARLTNPPDTPMLTGEPAKRGNAGEPRLVAVFPASRSRETELFRQLFPMGLPPDADLMRELIRAIRRGTIDLAPGPESGWYEYHVFALESFLMPERGQEHSRLLLTKAYKKRMLEAFQALMTKRRETFVRSLAEPKSEAPGPRPPAKIRPRLRVEPCPTYFLRMARSYDFIANVLVATVGEEGLASLHGLKEGGERTRTLLEELRWMREFFYGLHLLSAEDIGMAPALRADEPVDRAACEAKATEWLASFRKDADLAVDTRVSVPLYYNTRGGRTRLWGTIGVRLARLDVSYVRPPKIKPAQGTDEWQEVKPSQLEGIQYVIAVDEFAEAEVPGLQPLTRKEFRDVCNAYETKPEIVRALSRRSH